MCVCLRALSDLIRISWYADVLRYACRGARVCVRAYVCACFEGLLFGISSAVCVV